MKAVIIGARRPTAAASALSVATGKRQHDLAESLFPTVFPVFVHDEAGRPSDLGSCVLIGLDGRHYAFTVGHVIRDSGSSHLWAAAGNGKLEPLPYITRFSSQAEKDEVGDVDIGIVPLESTSLGPFAQCKFWEDLDVEGTVEHRWVENSYFVMGYPGSSRQFSRRLQFKNRSQRLPLLLRQLL